MQAGVVDKYVAFDTVSYLFRMNEIVFIFTHFMNLLQLFFVEK